MSMNGTSRGFLITHFGIDGLPDTWPSPGIELDSLPRDQLRADWEALFASDGQIAYAVWQFEVAPTSGSVHLQGYVHFKQPYRPTRIKKLVGGGVHVEPRRGTVEQAIQYCMKEDSRLVGPFEYGTRPGGQGSRTDLKEVTERLKTMPMIAAVEGFEETYVKYHRGFQALRSLYQQKNVVAIRQVRTHVKYGKTGVGKTYSVVTENPGLFIVPPPQGGLIWWDGYDGQEVILFDDFYGQVKPADMLRYLDVYQCQVPIKGGMVWAKWTKVYITSNVSPDEWWKNAELADEVRAAITRRLTVIEHVEERAE